MPLLSVLLPGEGQQSADAKPAQDMASNSQEMLRKEGLKEEKGKSVQEEQDVVGEGGSVEEVSGISQQLQPQATADDVVTEKVSPGEAYDPECDKPSYDPECLLQADAAVLHSSSLQPESAGDFTPFEDFKTLDVNRWQLEESWASQNSSCSAPVPNKESSQACLSAISHNLQSPRPDLQSPSHNLQSPPHDLQSPPHNLQSPHHDLQSPCHNLRLPCHDLESPRHDLQSPCHDLQSPCHDLQSPLRSRQHSMASEEEEVEGCCSLEGSVAATFSADSGLGDSMQTSFSCEDQEREDHSTAAPPAADADGGDTCVELEGRQNSMQSSEAAATGNLVLGPDQSTCSGDMMSQSFEITSQSSSEATSQSCEATSQSSEARSQSSEATSQRYEATSQSCEATSQSCESASQSSEATSMFSQDLNSQHDEHENDKDWRQSEDRGVTPYDMEEEGIPKSACVAIQEVLMDQAVIMTRGQKVMSDQAIMMTKGHEVVSDQAIVTGGQEVMSEQARGQEVMSEQARGQEVLSDQAIMMSETVEVETEGAESSPRSQAHDSSGHDTQESTGSDSSLAA
jgi:DNA-directed RNA polymerase II subunit RPB1